MRIFKRILFVFTSLLLLGYICLDVWIYNEYKTGRTEKLLNDFILKHSSLNENSIPENIIAAYEKVFPGSLTGCVYPDPVWYFSLDNISSHPQIKLARLFHLGGAKVLSVANQLDNAFTQKQCIYIYLQKFDFNNLAVGIDRAAEIYYGKSVPELTENEAVELMVMTINPVLYNKFRHPDRLEERVKELIAR